MSNKCGIPPLLTDEEIQNTQADVDWNDTGYIWCEKCDWKNSRYIWYGKCDVESLLKAQRDADVKFYTDQMEEVCIVCGKPLLVPQELDHIDTPKGKICLLCYRPEMMGARQEVKEEER